MPKGSGIPLSSNRLQFALFYPFLKKKWYDLDGLMISKKNRWLKRKLGEKVFGSSLCNNPKVEILTYLYPQIKKLRQRLAVWAAPQQPNASREDALRVTDRSVDRRRSPAGDFDRSVDHCL